MKLKNIFQKYPKLVILMLIVVFSYFVFKNQEILNFISKLDALNNIGIFIGGMLYSFGFTSPISAGFFLSIKTENILLSGMIGGFGAMIADLFIFKFIRISFMDEFKKLKQEKASIKIKNFTKKIIPSKIKIVLAYIFAGIFIGSPLPDEIGVMLLAGLSKIKASALSLIGFVLNTIGIIILLAIGKS